MKKNQTYTQILDASRKMFNEQGVESVSISQIAQALSISTGNLTYHFSRKKDMMDKHIIGLEAEVLHILNSFPYGGTAKEFSAAYVALFETTWKYRFLFNGTAYLIQNELISKTQYQNLVDHVYNVVLKQTEQLIESGVMTPIPDPHDTHTLVDCIWWQWLGWLDVNQLLPVGDQRDLKDLLKSGVKHLLFLTQPYMNKRFINSLYKELETI